MKRSTHRSRRRATWLELAYLPSRGCAAAMRTALRAFLVEQALDAAAVRDVVLATEEAFSNAVVHAGRDGVILVSATVEDGETRVQVRDVGRGFDTAAVDVDGVPRPDRTHGRGLFLIRRVMDRVEIASGEGGTTVRMVRRTA